MSKVKGVGFGVRFYRRAVPGKQMTDKRIDKGVDKPAKGKDTPPQEITEPFPRREMQPVIDVPDQFMKMELFESWPPVNAAQKLASEIQKAKQVLKKPFELELFPEEPVAQQAPVQRPEYKKPPALQAALDKVKAKQKARLEAKVEAKPEVKQAPRKQNIATDITKESALWVAAEKGDCHKIRLLVMQGVDLEMRDSYGRTALNIAMQYHKKDAIKTLMAAKEMRKMAVDGALPNMNFFRKLAKDKTGT